VVNSACTKLSRIAENNGLWGKSAVECDPTTGVTGDCVIRVIGVTGTDTPHPIYVTCSGALRHDRTISVMQIKSIRTKLHRPADLPVRHDADDAPDGSFQRGTPLNVAG
jgi:hypothetical protein